MTKMKKSGKWNFLQVLTGAFRKKREPSDEVTGNPVLPFASRHDIPAANQLTAEVEVKKYEALPETRHKTAAEAKKIESAGHLVTDLRPPALDLDIVQRETGLTNNAFAHHKAKIQPKRRAPGKYTEKLNQRSTSLDRLSEDSAAFIAENSESSDRPSLPIGNERDKGSLTPDSGGGLTDGSVNDLFELSSDCDLMETASKAVVRVAKKHSNENIEGKEDVVFLHLPAKKNLGTELPRACETGRTSNGAIDGGTFDNDPVVKKTAGAKNQHGSAESLLGDRAKTSCDVSLEEDRSSKLKVSETLEPAGGLSRSAKGSRKLPRTHVAAGENEPESLMSDSSVPGNNIWETSGVEMSASGSSLDSLGAGSRENRRKSLKAPKTDSKATVDRIRAKSLDDGNGVDDTVKENVRRKLNSDEMNVESEVKASSNKDRDEKSKRKRKVGFADETSAKIGVLENDDRPVESVKGGEDIWADIDPNENLATSVKDHLPDSSLVYHDGKDLSETNEQAGLKHDVKAPAAATAIPLRASRKDRGVKTDKISDVNETGTKGRAAVSEVVGSADFSKTFPKVRKSAIGDVAQESDKIKGGSTNSNDPSASGTSGDGNASSAMAKSIRKKAVSGDSVDISGGDGEKICGTEPSDRKTRPLDDSRDASSASSEARPVSKYPGFKTKSDNIKTAPRSSTENLAAAAGDESTNELDKAFQKVRSKPPVPGVPSSHSGHPQSAKPLPETQLPHSDCVKAAKNIPVPPAKSQFDAMGRSLGGSQRRIGDSKPAGNNSTVADSKKPMTVTAEADKTAADGDGSSSLLANKARLPPAPVPAKRQGKIQPKPAENEKEVAWVNKARRLSKDFGDRALSGETGSEGKKVDNEVGPDGNFTRGDKRTSSVKDIVRKFQQKSQNG